MPYSITTKDGITVNNIPDNVPADSPELKARVAAIRAEQQSAAPASTPTPPTALATQEPAKMGFLESIAESVTGRARATPETQALPEWTTMPELNQLSVASFKSALGSLVSNPKETVQILQSNFPQLGVRQDAKGNFILRSSVDQKEYAIPPGFSVGDIPRAVGGVLAFTPAGRATSILGAAGGAGLTQLGIEATQAATGGEINPTDIALATATGPVGQIIQKAVPPVVTAVKKGVARVTGQPAPVAARVEPTFEAPMSITPEAPAPLPTVEIPPTPTVAPVVAQVTEEEVGSLVKKASGTGFGSSAARDRLADLAQVNVAAKESAERLGIELPADVFSDNPQVRAAAGLTRSVAGGDAEAAWRNTVTQAVDKADDVIKQFDATFVEGTVAPAVVSQKIKDSLIKEQQTLAQQAKGLYESVDLKVPEQTFVTFPALKEKLAEITARLGTEGVEKNATLKMLNKMVKDADEGKVPYGRLKEEKTLIGDSIKGVQNDYSKSTSQGRLKEIYGALAKDQLDNVEKLADAEVRQQLRSANLLTAKEKAIGKRIINAFGQDIEGSLGSKLRSAIISGGKGDTGDFNRLLKIVPDEFRKETLATALASATRSARGAEKGGFGFSEFADLYPKLRANPPVFKTIVDTLGKDSADVLRDLFEISKRVTEARANVLTTGKANQALLQGIQAESLIGKIMESTLAKAAVTGAAAVSGPIAAGATSMITSALTQGNKDSLKAAGKLFADPAFQKLAIEAATSGQASNATLRSTAMSQSFQKFADAVKLPKTLDARIQFLQSAIQTERQLSQENP